MPRFNLPAKILTACLATVFAYVTGTGGDGSEAPEVTFWVDRELP